MILGALGAKNLHFSTAVAETVFLLQVTVRERLVICALQLLASFVSAPFGSVNVGAILGESGW